MDRGSGHGAGHLQLGLELGPGLCGPLIPEI